MGLEEKVTQRGANMKLEFVRKRKGFCVWDLARTSGRSWTSNKACESLLLSGMTLQKKERSFETLFHKVGYEVVGWCDVALCSDNRCSIKSNHKEGGDVGKIGKAGEE